MSRMRRVAACRCAGVVLLKTQAVTFVNMLWAELMLPRLTWASTASHRLPADVTSPVGNNGGIVATISSCSDAYAVREGPPGATRGGDDGVSSRLHADATRSD